MTSGCSCINLSAPKLTCTARGHMSADIRAEQRLGVWIVSEALLLGECILPSNRRMQKQIPEYL